MSIELNSKKSLWREWGDLKTVFTAITPCYTAHYLLWSLHTANGDPTSFKLHLIDYLQGLAHNLIGHFKQTL